MNAADSPVGTASVFGAFRARDLAWVGFFAGCLPLFPALLSGSRPLGLLEGLGLLITAGAIALTVIPISAYSFPCDLVIPIIPALEVE